MARRGGGGVSGNALGSVVSVRTGEVRDMVMPAWDRTGQASWSSAYLKRARDGAVHVGRLGLDGDQQADTAVHGGPEMAVLMYADTHYPTWRAEPGLSEMGPGGFGENLTVTPLDERTVCVGDVIVVGSCRLQISSPRGPCSAISRRWDDATLLARCSERRWTGWYLRVLDEGEVRAGDTITLESRPHPTWSIDRLLELRLRAPRHPAALAEAQTLAAMSAEWHGHFARLARAAATAQR